MRLLRFNRDFNWKYIFGEIFLIFVGISLAIGFNNWNTSSKTTKQKEIAISKIKKEIIDNREELNNARVINKTLIDAYSAFENIYGSTTAEVITSPQQLKQLQNIYPTFFRVLDSTEIKPGTYHYNGSTSVNLELANLTDIAWETTHSIRITGELNYDCLYDLQSMYNLQVKVATEFDKAAVALQQGKMNELMSVLNFIRQLDSQLESNYNEMLEVIDGCR